MSNRNGMVAHIWAQQDKASARSSNGNLSFEGPTLYSYSTPIGRFVTTKDGGRAVLVTSRTFSITTSSKHMPALWRAIGYGDTTSEGYPIFRVPVLCGASGLGYTHFDVDPAGHSANLAHLSSAYDELADKIRRARTIWCDEDSLAVSLESHNNRAAQYARLFGLEYTHRDIFADVAAIFAARAAAEAKRNTPAAIAKRAKAAAAREALAARKEALARADAAERIEAWREGRPVSLRYNESRDSEGGALLRVRNGNLETSMNASVPLDHAVKVFRFVKLCRERGEAWQRNGRTLRVGHFQVDAVTAEGNFRAGCHTINWPEVERAAEAAGVLNEAAADTREGQPHA